MRLDNSLRSFLFGISRNPELSVITLGYLLPASVVARVISLIAALAASNDRYPTNAVGISAMISEYMKGVVSRLPVIDLIVCAFHKVGNLIPIRMVKIKSRECGYQDSNVIPNHIHGLTAKSHGCSAK